MRRLGLALVVGLGCASEQPSALDPEELPHFDLGGGSPPRDPDPDRERREAELVADVTAYEQACPLVRYPALTPGLTRGPLVDVVATRLADGSTRHISGVGDVVMRSNVTEIAIADHPVRLPGVRFVHAYDFSSACMLGWSHRNCFVASTKVYCDGEVDFHAFVRDTGLHETPERLMPAAWSELVATFAGAERRLPAAAQVHACVDGVAPVYAARVRPGSEVRSGYADVVVALFDREEIVQVHVRIEHGAVSWRSERLWAPEPEDELVSP